MRRVLRRLRGSFDVAARLEDALVRRRVRLLDSLSGQVALVTGGNRGIGAEIARQLADRGATVYAGARDPATVGDPDHRPVELDVTDPDGIEAALDGIAEEAGRLDVLVNNAGVYGPTGRLGELDPGDAERTIGVNLHGPIAVTRAALPLLTEREGARIVNVSSQSGQFVGGIESESLPYGVSKAGLNAFTASLADQYPDLLVNAACPGPTRTEMVGPSAPRSVEEGADTPAWIARFAPGSPTGRLWKDRRPIGW
jgi:hypothetical protein